VAADRNPLNALGFARVADGHDLPLARRLQSHHVWALRGVPQAEAVRPEGQRYRKRAVPLDAATHRILNQWTY
jgi:hypothetical protein